MPTLRILAIGKMSVPGMYALALGELDAKAPSKQIAMNERQFAVVIAKICDEFNGGVQLEYAKHEDLMQLGKLLCDNVATHDV